ncbi:MAG TPA: hypothetical protein VK217_11755, partial [Acidimicrobiales bacterium]|nr:hypothetical protein [Acidimicrobiales bacterium]
MSAARRSPTDWSRRLAEALVGAGRIPGDTAVATLSEAASSGRPIAAVLADRGLVEPSASLAELSRISGIPSVDISETRPMGEAFRLVPELLARELTAIGYKLEGDRITLACAEPIDVGQQREISAFLEIEVAGCLLADPVAIEHLMNAVYPRLSSEGDLAAAATAATAATTAEVGATMVTSSTMNAPAQVPAPVMSGAQLPHDVSSNGAVEPGYD